MRTRLAPLTALLGVIFLAGCVPPPLVVGAGAAIGADAVLEERDGDDGLF